jgi:CMP-N-acetylneuraminic acid synthetase
MIAALILGRKGSVGLPNKNYKKILGKPMAWYPMDAALNSKYVDETYLSTNDEVLADLAESLGVGVIDRPEDLCSNKSVIDDAILHGLKEIGKNKKVDIVVILLCNAATILPETIDEGIEVLQKNDQYDSAITVSEHNMYNPSRAKKMEGEFLVPFHDFGDSASLSSDRDCMGEILFPNCSAVVIRADFLKKINTGQPPQRWMGNKIYPLRQEIGFDVDTEWQIPVLEWWLEKYKLENKENCK